MTRCAATEDLNRWMAAQDAQDGPNPWDDAEEQADADRYCERVAAELRAAGWVALADEVEESGDARRADEAADFVGGGW